jgi:multiple sugar transport system ATP-binding protein
MATVTFDNATRLYPGTDKPAVDKLDLEIADGEFLVLVGPSGCGKSTSLRMLAGLEDVNSGRILIGDRDVTDVPPKDRDIAMVFQNYALYPHMSVADNMGFALKIAGIGKEERAERVREAAKLLDLEEYLDRKPKALSGGQRQRVAMGRAIVRNPQVFLMDEPLSNLDAKLRVQTRTQIASLTRRLGVTTVYVTHDQVEAMTMGDRVAVLKDGILQQVDSPRNLYDTPANIFVAGFIGSPAMNLLELPVADGGVQFGGTVYPVPRDVLGSAHGSTVMLGCVRRTWSRLRTARDLPWKSMWSRSSAPTPTCTAIPKSTAAGTTSRAGWTAARRRGPAPSCTCARSRAMCTCSTPRPVCVWGITRLRRRRRPWLIWTGRWRRTRPEFRQRFRRISADGRQLAQRAYRLRAGGKTAPPAQRRSGRDPGLAEHHFCHHRRKPA